MGNIPGSTTQSSHWWVLQPLPRVPPGSGSGSGRLWDRLCVACGPPSVLLATRPRVCSSLLVGQVGKQKKPQKTKPIQLSPLTQKRTKRARDCCTLLLSAASLGDSFTEFGIYWNPSSIGKSIISLAGHLHFLFPLLHRTQDFGGVGGFVVFVAFSSLV